MQVEFQFIFHFKISFEMCWFATLGTLKLQLIPSWRNNGHTEYSVPIPTVIVGSRGCKCQFSCFQFYEKGTKPNGNLKGSITLGEKHTRWFFLFHFQQNTVSRNGLPTFKVYFLTKAMDEINNLHWKSSKPWRTCNASIAAVTTLLDER